jgi:hypothetical protein
VEDRECCRFAARATALPFKQVYQLAAPVAGLPVFMNSNGSIKGLPT